MSSVRLISDDDCDLEQLVTNLEMFSDDGSSIEYGRQLCATAATQMRNTIKREATLKMQLRLRDRALTTLGAHVTAFDTHLGVMERRNLEVEAIDRWGLLCTWCCCLLSQENLDEEGSDPGVCGQQRPQDLRAHDDERLGAVEEQEAILYARMQHIVEMHEEMAYYAHAEKRRDQARQRNKARHPKRADKEQAPALPLESARGEESWQQSQIGIGLLDRGLQLGDLTQSLQEEAAVAPFSTFQYSIDGHSKDLAHSTKENGGASLEEMVVVHADADLDQEVRYAMAMESDILGELEATIGVATALRGIRD